MAVVVATRLVPKGWPSVPAALKLSGETVALMTPLDGFLGARMRMDRRRVMWTLSAWSSPAALQAFRAAHAPVMERIGDVASDASSFAWRTDGAQLPDWDALAHRWTAVDPPAGGLSQVVQPAG